MKFFCFIVSVFMVSCSSVKVYKVGEKANADLHQEFMNTTFFVKGIGNQNTDYFSGIIKNKIISHLNRIGYKTSPEFSKSLPPAYMILFDCTSDFKTENSSYLTYKPGAAISTEGSAYSYSGGYTSYSATSTTPGTFSSVPYSYNIYTAILKVYVCDLKSINYGKPSMWTTSAFFSGEKARFIEQAADYLIPAIFDRFGKPTEGLAEEYEFSGDEPEIKFLKNLNKSEEVIKRK